MDNQNPPVTNPPVENPVSQIVIPPPPESLISNKLILIVIILILTFAGGGAYFVLNSKTKPQPTISNATPTSIPTPTPNPTANWKTYKDPNYNFSFKYPNEAGLTKKTLYSMLSRSESSGLEISPPRIGPFENWYSFDLAVKDNPQNTDVHTIVNNYMEEIKKDCTSPACDVPKKITDTLKPYKNGKIDGYIFNFGAETNSRMVVSAENNKTYIFRMTGDNGQVTDFGLKVLNQILSTFKFTL